MRFPAQPQHFCPGVSREAYYPYLPGCPHEVRHPINLQLR
jgi:hypothetical protein